MKIAICDDSPVDQMRISEYIMQYADRYLLDFRIDTFETGSALLQAFHKNEYKIIFLDIIMSGLSGVETAYKIREKSDECMIIFMTASPDFRAEGFDIGAVHYLMKPLTYSMVEEALHRCERQYEDSEKYFNVVVNRRTMQVHYKDILYLEVYGKCTMIHTFSDVLRTYTPLSTMESLLEKGPFLKSHRCYVVNMRCISGVLDDCFTLDNGEKVPIRRKGRQLIKDEYSRYFLDLTRRP